MTISVVETPPYQAQVANILQTTQRKAVQTLLSHDPFAGDEIQVGSYSLLQLNWTDDIKITYSVGYNEIFLLSITTGDVTFVAQNSKGTDSFLKKVGVGISIKLIAEGLIKFARDIDDWWNSIT
jgi:hypothetical protein